MSLARLIVVCALCVALAMAQDVNIPRPIIGVPISDNDAQCKVDADCIVVHSTCSYSCGVAVNADGAQRVANELRELCLQDGVVSNTFCPDTYPACESGLCVLKRVPGPVPVNQSLQTCRSDTDCAAFQPSCHGTPCCETTGIVGVSTSNVQELDSVWKRLCAGVPQPDCSTVRCMKPDANPTCVKGFCTINGAAPVIELPSQPQCDEKTKPNEFCQCVFSSRTDPTATAWVCPPTCPGEPPKGCYCAASFPGKDFDIRPNTPLEYRCIPDACASLPPPKDPSRCYCGVPAGTLTNYRDTLSKPEWICEPDSCCPSNFEKPANLACPASEAKVWCNEQTCKWEYTCPRPPVCTCDNLPLPILEAEKAGCDTRSARWFCATSVGIVDGNVVAVNTSTSETSPINTGNKRQDAHITPIYPCAKWDFTCNPIPECVANFDCGFNCYDASQAIPKIRCLLPEDPVSVCEQRCLKQFAKCAPLVLGSVRSCTAIKSEDYDICVKKCQGVKPPVDKCTFIRDKCNCEAAGCGWCEEELFITEPLETSVGLAPNANVRVGYCSSLNSKYQCTSPRHTFSTAEVSASGEIIKPTCNVILPIDPPVITPVDPTVPEIDRCLLDDRCISTVDLNKRIEETRASDGDAVAKDFAVFITLVMKAEQGLVNLAVDLHSEREPTAEEADKICRIVATSISKQLKFDPKRVRKCKLAKVSSDSPKRDTTSQSYIASMTVDPITTDNGDSSDNGQAGSASTLAFSALAALIAALALLF